MAEAQNRQTWPCGTQQSLTVTFGPMQDLDLESLAKAFPSCPLHGKECRKAH